MRTFLLAAGLAFLAASPAFATPRPIDSLDNFVMRAPPAGCRPTLFNYGERDIESVTVTCDSREAFVTAYTLSERMTARATCPSNPDARPYVCRITRP